MEQKREPLAQVVEAHMAAASLSQRALAAATGIALPTLNRRLVRPDEFTSRELGAIARAVAPAGTTLRGSDLLAEAERLEARAEDAA